MSPGALALTLIAVLIRDRPSLPHTAIMQDSRCLSAHKERSTTVTAIATRVRSLLPQTLTRMLFQEIADEVHDLGHVAQACSRLQA